MKAYALPGNRDDVTGIRKQMGKFFFLDLEGFTQTYTSDVYVSHSFAAPSPKNMT